jgi:hypothetical protein
MLSALPPKADIPGGERDVRFVPIADMIRVRFSERPDQFLLRKALASVNCGRSLSACSHMLTSFS